MRALETALFLANLLAFVFLLVPLPHAARWMRYPALIAPLLAGVQAAVEGPRWQMAPAYAFTGLLVVAWVMQSSVLVGQPGVQRQVNRLAYTLAVVLGVFGLAVSILLPVISPIFRFPRPTGPYAIGTLTYHWVDANRAEIFTPDPNDRRELMVQVWYPAKADPSSPRAPYLPDADALISEFVRVQGKPAFKLLFGNLQYITTNAVYAAPAAGSQRFPVLIFLEGTTGFRQMNTFQVEELVSHGYIVAAVDQPYTAAAVVFPGGRKAVMPPVEQIKPLIRASYIPPAQPPLLNGQPLPDGSIIPYLAQDVGFTLDQLAVLNKADPNGILTGRLDLDHAGTFGISQGGIVASEACALDARLRACLFMDAPMTIHAVQAGLQQPGMWITRDADTMRLERQRAGGWPEDEIEAHQTTMRALYERLPGDGYFVKVPGIFHANFTDIPYWSPLIAWMGVAGPVDAQRAYDIINAYSLAFFDRHLKGQPVARFKDLATRYPEVSLETRLPYSTGKK